MIAKLATWLSKRFPERLEVSAHDYKELREEVASYNRLIPAIQELDRRVSALEKTLKAITVEKGFVEGPVRGSIGRLER